MRKRGKHKRMFNRLMIRSSRRTAKKPVQYKKKKVKRAKYPKKKARKYARYKKKGVRRPNYSKKRVKKARRVSLPKRIPKDVARKYLRNVSPEKSFWISDGPIIKNLGELLRELKTMSPGAFSYHVNKKRNDFSKWISEVIGDKTLARVIRKARTRAALYNNVKVRVKMMRRVIGS